MIALIAAFFVVRAVTNPDRRAAAMAREYFQAIEDGDAETAATYLEIPDELSCPDLLTTEVYSTVPNRPQLVSVDSADLFSEEWALASVTYLPDPGASETTGSLSFTRASEIKEWHLSGSSVATLERAYLLLEGPGTLSFNGACDAVNPALNGVYLLPGQYTIEYQDPLNVGELEPITLAYPRAFEVLTLTPQAKPEIVTATQEALRARILSCLESNLTEPKCAPSFPDAMYTVDTFSAVDDLDISVEIRGGYQSTADDPPADWTYIMEPVTIEVTGTMTRSDCIDAVCTEPWSTTLTYGFSGSVTADAQGAVTLEEFTP